MSPPLGIPRAAIAANEPVDIAPAANKWHRDRQTRSEAKVSFAARKEKVARAAERKITAVAVVAALEALAFAQAAAAEALDAIRTGVVRLLELE